MAIPLSILAIACLFLIRYALRPSALAFVLATVVVGYVFGHDFWHKDIGPLPLTLDRILLLAIALQFGWQMYHGKLADTKLTKIDWIVCLLLGVLTVSYAANRAGTPPQPDSPFFRLIISFITPGFLYLVLRHQTFDQKSLRWIFGVFTVLGVYLGLTAFLETSGTWSFVFPRYIADPELGLHFGRARGPGLNSVSLGVVLSFCALAAWLWIKPLPTWVKAMVLPLIGLMCLGVLLTYTRSTWLGLAGAIVVVVAFQAPKPLRKTALVGCCLLGCLLLVVGKDALVGLKREDSASVSAHSVQQRAAFAYVTWQMYKDHPLTGVGYGRYYDKKLPYLNDRRQSFELESLRPLHHHNTFLSVLIETGPLGLAAYCGMLFGFAAFGWHVANQEADGSPQQQLGVFLLAGTMIYLPSALFHDLTLIHICQWLVFIAGGAAIGCWINNPLKAKAMNKKPSLDRTSGASSLAWNKTQPLT